MLRFSVPTLLLVLAFAAMAGPAAAKEDSLLVGSMVHEGPALQRGDLAMLFVRDTSDSGPEAQAATPWITGTAGQLRTVEYSVTSSRVDAPWPEPLPPAVDGLPTPETEEDPVETTFLSAQLKLASHQPGFEAHGFAVEGLVPFTATTDERRIQPGEQAEMHRGSMGERADADGVGSAELTSSTFAYVRREGPLTLQEGSPSHTEVVLRGSFVLEVFGLTFDVKGANAEKTVASGAWKDPAVEGQDAANDVRETFVRMFFEDAEVSIAVDGGTPDIRWATGAVELRPDGPVTFYNTNGKVDDVLLQDARYVLQPGSVLAIAPQQDGLHVGVSEAKLGPRGTIADVPAPASAALVGSGAVLALLVAIGIGLLRRLLRLPQLAEVERAIEDGEYRRAARLAGRILARRPDDESAVLARGIALSKVGDQRRTVAELSGHLAQRPASDGSLHYVLGLAQIELGQKDAGQASLREAVRLTPSLQAEVGSRLGKAFSSPAPTTKETNGYA